MKFSQVEATFVCQLGKPHNKAMLEGYSKRKDRSVKELAQYYIDVINALKDTPAWGVSGVNRMVNELTAACRATFAKAKKGKISASAHANKLLRYIEYFEAQEAEPRYNGRYKLAPILTEKELKQLISEA